MRETFIVISFNLETEVENILPWAKIKFSLKVALDRRSAEDQN